MRSALDIYEQVVIKIFEHCGFRYEPGPTPGPNEFYAVEVAEIPHGDFLQKIIPGYWVRSAAVNLGDARRACDDVSNYLQLVPVFFQNGKDALSEEWLDRHLPTIVSDELRLHVFCFLSASESIRDEIRLNLNSAQLLVPRPPVRQYESSQQIDVLAQSLVTCADLTETDAEWAAQRLSDLDIHCKQTRDSIDEFVSDVEVPVDILIQRFANVQAAMLELARILIDVDYAVDVLGYKVFQ